ncbi:MAG: hypothetical protein RLZZ383_2563 [Pseudomonadota bacterium]
MSSSPERPRRVRILRVAPSDRARDHHVTWAALALVLSAADLGWQADAVWAPTGVSALGTGPLRDLAADAPANLVGGGCAWAACGLGLVALVRSTARGPWLFGAATAWALAWGGLSSRLPSAIDAAVLAVAWSASWTSGWRRGRAVAAVDGWAWFALRFAWLVVAYDLVGRLLGGAGPSALARGAVLGASGDTLDAADAAIRAAGGLVVTPWLAWPWMPRRLRSGMAVLLVLLSLGVSVVQLTGVLPVLAVAIALAALDDDWVARREARAQWTAPSGTAGQLVPLMQRALLAAGIAWVSAPMLGLGATLRAMGVPTTLPATQAGGALQLVADGAVVPWRALDADETPWGLPTSWPRLDAALSGDPACDDIAELAARLVAQLASGSAPVAAAVGDLRFATPTAATIAVRTHAGRTCAAVEDVDQD